MPPGSRCGRVRRCCPRRSSRRAGSPNCEGGAQISSDDLDKLYTARPEEFTALRAELAAAAKKDGDAETARRIRDCRKPTTAAWLVNRLALTGDARSELGDLGSRLRDAHSVMDGDAIRALTAEQRTLVERLTRAAFREGEVASPSAALHDDVTATLQAAIADPDVAARLGRLTKAEQWSGFGDFGFSATVSSVSKPRSKPEPDPAELAALAELQSNLARARIEHENARRRLAEAEQALTAAEDAVKSAKRAAGR
ncbi:MULTISPECIES: hypothetical protein [Mycolicibacterium]|uniref:Uncharacterized protein n=1 Tax=Mycolicibacterium gilvum (strain PYR-GCK) TaxID=350054 RepID=A4T440_MYCGI|nr:hypothetical protein Mflv_1074 [Mycolicibacterium gilvum PYR-GCK]